MKKDLVKALGVKVFTADISDFVIPDYDWQDVVLVKDLRAALEKLPVVYGVSYSDGQVTWKTTPHESDTHSARLLAIEEIKKEPLKEVFELNADQSIEYSLNKFKGKRVRLTVEEIVGE